MSTATQDLDLWPDDVRTPERVLSPYQLLRDQARRLDQHTHGLVRADIVRIEAEDRIAYRFELIVPDLDYRSTLFEVTHRRDHVYPCVIQPPGPLPEFLRPRKYVPGRADTFYEASQGGRWIENEWFAATQDEFVEKLKKVLHSAEARSTLTSLIARSQESGSAASAGVASNGNTGDP